MKKTLVIIALIIVISSFALIPGMKKKMYGAGVFFWPFPFALGVDGYYTEGNSIYQVPNMKINVDGYLGAGFDGAFVALYSFGFGAELDLLASVVISKEDLHFDLFGYKIIPAVKLDTGIYYSISGAGVGYYSYIHEPGFGIKGPYLYLTFFTPWKKGKYLNFYFWPVPLIFGASVMEY